MTKWASLEDLAVERLWAMFCDEKIPDRRRWVWVQRTSAANWPNGINKNRKKRKQEGKPTLSET